MIPNVSPPNDESDAPPKKWQVGTLHYATGGLVLVFIWLLCGDFALALRDRAVPPVMQILFKKSNASDLITGLVFSTLPTALGLIICPVVGFRSDRLRTRWGRRIPFLLAPVPFVVLAIVGLAFSPRLGDRLGWILGSWTPGHNVCVLLLLALFWTLFEVCFLINNNVFPALVNDVVPPLVIGRFYGLFRAVSLIAGIIFFYKGMGLAEKQSVLILLGIAALYGGGVLVMCLNVKEGTYPPVAATEAPRKGLVPSIRVYFKEAFGHSFYVWYFGCVLLGYLCALPFNLYSLFYAQSVGMSLDAYGKCIALTYACSLVLSYPLGILADRFHPLRVTLAGLVLYTVVMFCGGVFTDGARQFAVFFVLHGVISGCLFTAWASLPQRLYVRARFAELSSAAWIIQALGTMVVVPLFGVFLDSVHHNYRYTFFICAALTFMTLVAYIYLHVRFMAMGGPKHYVAPV